MCCCEKPNVNGEPGYRWQPNDAPGIRQPAPPELKEGETLLHDEPGRCGGLDSHCHHYRVVSDHGIVYLLVRNGLGDHRIELYGCGKTFKEAIANLDSTTRYWLLNSMYDVQENRSREARYAEANKWQKAAIEKRITVNRRGRIAKVSIAAAVLGLASLSFAAEKYYCKATHLGPGAVAVSCLNGGDPTVRGNIGGALIVSCGVR